MPNTEQLPAGLVERVLAGLGFSGPPAPDLDGLKTVYAAWCRRVPFDNVLKRIHLASGDPGPLPGDDDSRFFESWLRFGTGGLCWAGNGALCSLLTALNFSAARGLATMLTGPDPPPNHGTVVVACDGRRFVVDASMLHGEPLPLDDYRPTGVGHPAWGVCCTRQSGRWHIRWRPLHMTGGLVCRIDRLDAPRDAFLRLNEETRRWSPFNYSLYARLIRGRPGRGHFRRAEGRLRFIRQHLPDAHGRGGAPPLHGRGHRHRGGDPPKAPAGQAHTAPPEIHEVYS